jgi:transposase
MSSNLPDKSNSKTLVREDFQMISVEKVSPSTLTLKCPPEIIDDLIWILEKLVLMSRYLKRYVKYAEAEARANAAENRALLQAQFNDKSRRVYLQYVFLQKSGYSRSEAIKELKKEFNMGYYDVEIYVSQGRKLEKEEKLSRIRQDHAEGGYSISELAALHGMSYNTVRNIVYGTK